MSGRGRRRTAAEMKTPSGRPSPACPSARLACNRGQFLPTAISSDRPGRSPLLTALYSEKGTGPLRPRLQQSRIGQRSKAGDPRVTISLH